MNGFPKRITTKNDVEFLMTYLGTAEATPDNKARGLEFLNGLADSAQSYQFDRVLSASEQADGAEPTYIVLTQEDNTRHQYKLQQDLNGLMNRMGYTVADVNQLIATVEGAA